MEHKVLVYGYSFPDNRNFCARLAFLFKDNKITSQRAFELLIYHLLINKQIYTPTLCPEFTESINSLKILIDSNLFTKRYLQSRIYNNVHLTRCNNMHTTKIISICNFTITRVNTNSIDRIQV
jgi:hypothetical protein